MVREGERGVTRGEDVEGKGTGNIKAGTERGKEEGRKRREGEKRGGEEERRTEGEKEMRRE